MKRKYLILTLVTALFASVVIGCGKAEKTEASAEFTESAKNEESEEQSGDSLTDKLFDKDEGSEEISLLAKQTKYYSDDSIVFWIENEYDARGKMTKRTRYDSDGSISFWYEWEYNAQGNKAKQTRYVADGSISDWYEYEYDAQGNMTKETDYSSNVSRGYWYEWEYDAQGNMTKETRYNHGSIDYWFEYEYITITSGEGESEVPLKEESFGIYNMSRVFIIDILKKAIE